MRTLTLTPTLTLTRALILTRTLNRALTLNLTLTLTPTPDPVFFGKLQLSHVKKEKSVFLPLKVFKLPGELQNSMFRGVQSPCKSDHTISPPSPGRDAWSDTTPLTDSRQTS